MSDTIKVEGIDEDFVDIINILIKNGFKPFASCDGVLDHHEEKDKVLDAYISFMESPRILELMSAFKRDNIFRLSISNESNHLPYKLYGNKIEGNRYSLYDVDAEEFVDIDDDYDDPSL